MAKRPSLTVRIVLPTLLLVLVAAGAGITFVRHSMEQEALRHARIIAHFLLERNMATHEYFGGELKPSVFKLAEGMQGDIPFDPAWMSSTYAVREIDKRFQARFDGVHYYYKECAVNARSPENEADVLERQILARMGAESELHEWSERRVIDGEPFFVFMLKGESMEEGCLGCHSDPDLAPADLVARYGPKRSFGRVAGELVSAISIRIPLADTLDYTRGVAFNVSLALVGVVAALALALWSTTYRAVVFPLRRMAAQAAEIAAAPEKLGVELEPFAGSAEVETLAAALSSMSRSLGQHQHNLEGLVAARTQELALAEQAARAERDRFLTLFEQSADTILLLQAQAHGPPTIVDMNQAGLALHGREKSELLGQPITVLDTEEGVERVPERLKKILEDGEAGFEVTHRCAGGAELLLEVRAKRVVLDGHTYILSVERDITQRRKLEKRLLEAKKMEALGTMAGGLAHDFNNMLAVIIGNAEMASERAAQGSEDEEDLNEVLKAAKRSRDLVQKVLTYSRKASDSRQVLGLGPLVEQVVLQVRQDAPESVGWTLDPPCERDMVSGNAGQLAELLQNLLRNALQALPGGSGTIQVRVARIEAAAAVERRVAGLSAGPHVVLSVVDDGVGMAPETQDRAFDPFFSTSELGERTGMGLAVVQGVVKGHGGAIDVQSKPGSGTRVDVYLPAVTRDAGNPA